MAIQMRRGVYGNFDNSQLLPGEWAIVLKDDPSASDGHAAYISFAAGTSKRIATWEDLLDWLNNNKPETYAALTDAVGKTKAATEAAKTATANANTATANANTAKANADTATTNANAAAARCDDVVAGKFPVATSTSIGAVLSSESVTVADDGKMTVSLPDAAGVLPVEHGGTGLAVEPSMLTDLSSTEGASPISESPRPGVTGVLPVENGGTGAATAEDARAALGVETPSDVVGRGYPVGIAIWLRAGMTPNGVGIPGTWERQHFGLVGLNSGKALDVSGGNTKNCTNVQIYDRNFTRSQSWWLQTVKADTTTYRFTFELWTRIA